MKTNISFFSLFFEVWIHPRKVIRTLLDRDPGFYVWELIIAYAVLQAFLPDFYISFLSRVSLGLAVFIGLLISIVSDIAFFFIFSWLTYWIGKLLGGQGGWAELKAAYAWCYPPSLIGIVFLQLKGLPIWLRMMTGETDGKALLLEPSMWWQSLFQVFSLLFVVWTLVLWLINISEAHKISVLKSVGIVALIIIPIFLLAIGAGIFLALHNLQAR